MKEFLNFKKYMHHRKPDQPVVEAMAREAEEALAEMDQTAIQKLGRAFQAYERKAEKCVQSQSKGRAISKEATDLVSKLFSSKLDYSK